MQTSGIVSVTAAAACLAAAALTAQAKREVALPDPAKPLTRASGYRGVWYANQPSRDEYRYKYSGGLGTYCAKHQPFAVYRPQVDRTFFVYGGSTPHDPRRLVHMVSYFDHGHGSVPRPAILLDKKTDDAHDNPVLAIDEPGHLWVFSTSHGLGRPSFVCRSVEPYAIDRFEPVAATYENDDGGRVPLDNFSYMQAWHVQGYGFACLFTRYGDLSARTNMFICSADGVEWSKWQRLAGIEQGHYQISGVWNGEGPDGVRRSKVAAMSNYHPEGKGLNWRTNLYYMEAELTAPGELPVWSDVTGRALELPLTSPDNPALVHGYAAEGKLVYLKDLNFDAEGNPVLLFITSKGYEAGPDNGPRTWTTAQWLPTSSSWRIRTITTSDNNYDMGSLWIDRLGWTVIAPTDPGPQAFNPGGEMVLWRSGDEGATWRKVRRVTEGSDHNHTYARRPVDAHPGFYALWADGHGREPSTSRLWFADADGRPFVLPESFADGEAEHTPTRR